MKNRKLFISILTGLCACLMSATLLTACKDDHTHSYTEQTVNATCTEKGVTIYTCDCGNVYTEELPALGHDYVPHEAQAPTCTEIGWNTYNTCSRCNYTEYEEIPVLSHDEKTHEAKAPTCTEIGWNEYVTCERDGCEYSTYEEIPATGNHTWNSGEITTEPTCTEKGVKTFTCTVCQTATYTEDVPALDHNKVQHNAQVATCTEKGWNAYETCTRCSYTTYVEIPALNHDKVQHNAQAATCTEIGWEAYETCTRCDYTTYVELPALTHDKVQHNAQAATCTEKGWNAYETCTRCDYTTYVELPALNHDKVQHNAQAATCTEIGWNAYETCTRCDYTTYVELPALTHDKVQHNAQAATCTEKGWNAYETCTRCDYTTYVELPATGNHTWNDGEITTESTCTKTGVKTFTCTVCKTATKTEDVPTLEHDYSEEWKYDENKHWNECTCGARQGETAHSGGNVTCTAKAVCSTCNQAYGSTLNHEYTTLNYNTTFHWYDCATCDKVNDKEEHTDNGSGNCTVCDYPIGPTEGIMYDISADGTYAEVIGYESTATKIRIAETYQGVPVKTIYDEAFYNNDKITSVIIPDSITTIGEGAFQYCDSLTSVTIPDSVTSIGGYAFAWCNTLMSVEVGNNVTSIGDFAFNGCSNLTGIVIPDSVTFIGERAFEDCSGLTFNEYGNCKYLANKNNPYYALIEATNTKYSSYTIYEGTKIIASRAFAGCSRMTSIVIPDGVTSINKYAFYYCSNLTSVVISDGVTSINDEAFYSCDNLTSATCPAFAISCLPKSQLQSVRITSGESIGEDAFYYCSSLTSIEIPDSVTSIGGYAFYECSNLTSVYISDIAAWCKISFGFYANPLRYAKNLYLNNELVTELIIPDSVTFIGDSAFRGCSSLTSITIPDSVTSIGGYAFYECSNLTSVYISDIAAWCKISFDPSSYANPLYYAHNLYLNNELVTELVIPNGVTSIGNWAFYYCSSLTSVTIPDSVTSIGNWAFYYCDSLKSVVIGNGVVSIGNSAFESCSSLTSITIPDSVTSIGDGAFKYCNSLTSLKIGNSVTIIGHDAFRFCDNLINVVIPNSVTMIGDSAFDGDNLTTLTFEDTSTWYRTQKESDWNNKTGGEQIELTDPTVNATYFKAPTDVAWWYSYCWYKL